jgi:hypothetical protein
LPVAPAWASLCNMRRIILAALLALASSLAFAQAPPPVPALPDTTRVTSYNISGTKCTCAVNFAIYGDGTDVDAWIQVTINGAPVLSTDPTFGWALSSPTGPLGSIARPITDAVLTFNHNQTGTIAIIGARRPRRLSQFNENAGVTARDLNVVLTDIVAQNRENWDRVRGTTPILTTPVACLGDITAAVNAALTVGANVSIGPGSCTVSGSITFKNNNQSVTGAPGPATVITTTGGTYDTFVSSGLSAITISDMEIDDSKNDGYMFNLSAGGQFRIFNIVSFIVNNFIRAHNFNDLSVHHSNIGDIVGTNGIFLDGIDNAGSNVVDLHHVIMSGFGNTATCININGNIDTVNIFHVECNAAFNRGLWVQNSGSVTAPLFVFADQFAADTNRAEGIRLDAGSVFFFTNLYVHGSQTTDNIKIASGVSDVKIVNAQIESANQCGINNTSTTASLALFGIAWGANATNNTCGNGDQSASKVHSVPFVASGSTVTWTAMPAAATFFNGNSGIATRDNLTAYTQARLVVNKQGTACNTGGTIALQYANGTPLTVGNYITIGRSAVSVACDTTNAVQDSGWIDLVNAAQNDVYLSVVGATGNGAISPVFGNITAYFR